VGLDAILHAQLVQQRQAEVVLEGKRLQKLVVKHELGRSEHILKLTIINRQKKIVVKHELGL
jgi:hypothetical protein